MEQAKKIWSIARRVMSSRLLAAGLMGVFTLLVAVGVSVNSHAVTVTDGEESRVVLTMHSDPYQVLSAAGVTLEEHDGLHIDRLAETLEVNRAITVEVQADGVSTVLHLTEGTAADALVRAGVTVGSQDQMNVEMSTPVTEGMLIEVDRVAYREYEVTESIPFETNVRYTPVLRPGATRVQQSGEKGEKTITYRKTIVNGEVTDTEIVGEKVTKKPVTQQVIKGSSYGTPYSKAPFSIALNSKNQPVNYKKKFSGSCTAYASGKRGASGMRLGVGTVAVNPKQIPYGSKLWITSADGKFVYGYAIAADTGGFATKGRTICDLYMGSYREACLFGRRDLNIYVLE